MTKNNIQSAQAEAPARWKPKNQYQPQIPVSHHCVQLFTLSGPGQRSILAAAIALQTLDRQANLRRLSFHVLGGEARRAEGFRVISNGSLMLVDLAAIRMMAPREEEVEDTVAGVFA